MRRASGLPHSDAIRDPARVARVQEVLARLNGSAVLAGLVRLAGRVSAAEYAQLSLLGDEQTSTAVRCVDESSTELTCAIEDSLCTVAVLSGDVLVAADARAHPWLHDLPPVLAAAVGAYLGVPLRLSDGTSVGALCVYGAQPREWSDREIGLVCDIADLVAAELQRLVGP